MIAYAASASTFVIWLIRRDLLKRPAGRSLVRRIFVYLPAVLFLAPIAFSGFDLPSIDTPGPAQTLGGVSFILAFLSFLVLPLVCGGTLSDAWRCVPICWGLYLLWIGFVLFPLMLFSGVPLQD